ncbi:hypothetical protein SUGI_0683640 [Cryptomeria japonica]|nr:hypothetical protein SUGI_0683640 [Cryptomeria japonica]
MDFDARAEDHKQVSRISISSNCSPDLETFAVEKNLHLMEIETLPVSLKSLSIRKCHVLKNIGCISGLVSLEVLFISDCPQIQELPSFADLASLRRFDVLALECDTISAVKPYIQSMKECPSFLKIQGSVSRVTEPAVNSLAFPDLVVNEVDETSGHSCKGDYLFYLEGKEKNEEERKVVRISVCLDRYMSISKLLSFGGSVEVEREKAVVVEGRRERVVEAFYRLLARLE